MPTKKPTNPSNPIQHVVIIFKENHAFDNYFGKYPGVEGDPNLTPAPNPPPGLAGESHQSCAPAVRSNRHPGLLGLRAPVRHLRSLFYGYRRPIHAQPPDGNCGRLTHHQQPAFIGPQKTAPPLQTQFTPGPPAESQADLGKLRRVCLPLHHRLEEQPFKQNFDAVCDRCGCRKAANRILGVCS